MRIEKKEKIINNYNLPQAVKKIYLNFQENSHTTDKYKKSPLG